MSFTAWKFITAVTLLTAMAAPIQLAAQAQQYQQKQIHYVVQDLGQLGGTVFLASAEGISNRGLGNRRRERGRQSEPARFPLARRRYDRFGYVRWNVE